MRPRDYFEKPRRRDVFAAVTDAANELHRRLTEYSQYVTVSISAARGIFDTSRVGEFRAAAPRRAVLAPRYRTRFCARASSNIKKLSHGNMNKCLIDNNKDSPIII